MADLSDLKAGDEVAVSYGHWGGPTIHRVEKRTRVGRNGTLVVDGRNFDAKTGHQRGGGYSRGLLLRVTDDIRDRFERRRLLHEIGCMKLDDLPTATLRTIAEAVEQARRALEEAIR